LKTVVTLRPLFMVSGLPRATFMSH